ncbi:hypothetical protein [Modestobacter italicus]|uniref:hypothetical protein n=1 Tax=Modestobacter italicus (strain DSM 44449 / CECT 9708 / BC 501) TaxID=2732864 RepID=UPI001C93E555|nr:hypothetical protein [Modestobacter italicus]
MSRHELTVDGEDFVVTARAGGHDFTWVSGPHRPHYGFSSSRPQMTEAQMRAAITGFLAEINPETGYLD